MEPVNQPSVAIVILNYNGKKYLEKFLQQVVNSTYSNKRVIVADNASTDDSICFLKQHFPSVEIIINDQNYGFAEGYNVALKQVESDYYVLLNSDVEVTTSWIEPVIELMQKNDRIAVCQPKLLSYADRAYFEYAGAAGGWLDTLGYPFAKGRVFEICEKDEHQFDEATKIFWATGATMFVKSNVYHELGGLDSFFFAHQEEIDFCWRVQRAGYEVYYCPDATVYHVGGGTLPKGHRKTFLNFRNNMLMLFKNLPTSEKLWKIPLRIVMDWLFAIKSIFGGEMENISAVYKAHMAVWKWCLMKKEKDTLPKKKTNSLDGVYNGAIVWTYFIQKKKYFKEIIRS